MNFEIRRLDGRTDSDVLADLIRDMPPGRVIPYAEFIQTLNIGAPEPFSVRRAQSAVSRARKRLLVEFKRAFLNVPRVGYKIALASEHKDIAARHKRRADRQIQTGLEVLQNVNLAAIKDPEARQATIGMLVLMSGMLENNRALERRQDRVEAMLYKFMAQENTNNPVGDTDVRIPSSQS